MNSLQCELPLAITSHKDRDTFTHVIYDYYKESGRDLPWRQTRDPYHIFVSEFMLQQTQVERVLKKYGHFILMFPDFETLHRASLLRVLSFWSGLGYNRRCIYMKRCAQIIYTLHGGALPDSVDTLSRLPGIGRATASALVTFSYDRPTIFIETNIRSVFLHFFFGQGERVPDAELLTCVEKTLDRSSPRIWYYALMDYGTMLKKFRENPNIRSKSYKKQPPFEGSNRQVRGKVLKVLVAEPHLSENEIALRTKTQSHRVGKVLSELEKEGFIRRMGSMYEIAD